MNGVKTSYLARTSGDVRNEIGTPISFRQNPALLGDLPANVHQLTHWLVGPPWTASPTLTSH
jgi:hypothetical protein